MKAIMSNTLREIIRDPKKNEELKKGLSLLHNRDGNQQEKATVAIGGKIYEVKFVSQDPKE